MKYANENQPVSLLNEKSPSIGIRDTFYGANEINIVIIYKFIMMGVETYNH